MTWTDETGRWHAIERYRKAIIKSDLCHALAIKLAWLLAVLCRQRGYAYPSNARLAVELGVSARRARLALEQLDKAGAILRCRVKGQRRIFLSEDFIERVLKNAGNLERRNNGGPEQRGSTPYGGTTGGHHTVNTKAHRRRPSRPTGMTAREMIEAEDAVADKGTTRH